MQTLKNKNLFEKEESTNHVHNELWDLTGLNKHEKSLNCNFVEQIPKYIIMYVDGRYLVQ